MATAHFIVRLILFAFLFLSFHLHAQPGPDPEPAIDSLTIAQPKLRQITVETGPLLCNEAENFNGIDLDGPGNIYGETEIMHDGYFVTAGITWGFKEGHDISGKYSLVKINLSKEAQIGDTLSIDDQYPLFRHQFYLSSKINAGKGFYLLPAIHFLLDCYETVMPAPGMDSTEWFFPSEQFRTGSYIGYLSAAKDFRYIQTRIFTAISNLNETKQFQLGFQLDVYPLGNPCLVISSKLLNHRDNGNNNLVFDQGLDFCLAKQVMAEVNATFGKMNNYYEDNAGEVYDLFSKLTFKGIAKITFAPGPGLKISGEYQYLAGAGSYMYNEKTGTGENSLIAPVTSYRDFLSQVYLIGVSWSF